jgi:hypothetical protein
MPEYYFAFYGEGKADYEFLLKVIERYLKQLLPHIDFTADIVHHIEAPTEKERLLKLAEDYAGLHFIIVHFDADSRTEDNVLQNRFLPAYEEASNKRCIPIIPIKESEAWMLVDYEAFKQSVGTKLSAKELDFPSQAHQVETINEPKEILNKALSLAQAKRRRIDLDELYAPMGELVSLELLDKVPAFQNFQSRVRKTLIEIGFRELEQS